jgi:hypothetical protein
MSIAQSPHYHILRPRRTYSSNAVKLGIPVSTSMYFCLTVLLLQQIHEVGNIVKYLDWSVFAMKNLLIISLSGTLFLMIGTVTYHPTVGYAQHDTSRIGYGRHTVTKYYGMAQHTLKREN